MIPLTQDEKNILAILQKNIPDTLTPYKTIADLCGVEEKTVLELIARLKEAGAIRRFGAMIRHQKTEWIHNAMVAWKVPEDQRDAFATFAASVPTISHVYFRPSMHKDWPYTVYTMVHGRSEEECQAGITTLSTAWSALEYCVLKTKKELKKVSMTYF